MRIIVRFATLLVFIPQCAFAQYPLVSIYDLQYIDPQGLSDGIDTNSYYLDTVQVEGIVAFDPCDYGLSTTGGRVGTWLQGTSGGAFNGILILIDAAAIGYSAGLNALNNDVQFIDNFQLGNKLKCTGIVSNFGLSSAPVPGNSQITGEFRWKCSPPLITPADNAADPDVALKDPTMVFHEGKWHLFATHRRASGKS